jgi:FkbM family methyltransferase
MKRLALKLFGKIANFFQKSKEPSSSGVVSYAQEGEDLLLCRLLKKTDKGFYVDIGAHDPVRYSNTNLFHLKGWTGINVDASVESIQRFQSTRPRDINLCFAVSSMSGEHEMFIFEEGALTTGSAELAEKYQRAGWKLIGKRKVKSITLAKLFDAHLPEDVRISFLSIDIEGLDLEALQGNDWTKRRPEIVLIEILDFHLDDCCSDPIVKFMRTHEYELVSKTLNTAFFRDTRQSI